jgi:hypothetical protein
MTDVKSSTGRVRQHRQRSRVSGNTRLEVVIGADVADDVKKLARQRGCPIWQIVEAALIAHVAGNAPHQEGPK